jgi:hypothetical protein
MTAGTWSSIVAVASAGVSFALRDATGAPLERITPEADLTPGSLLVTNDSIWTTSSDDGVLYRLTLG